MTQKTRHFYEFGPFCLDPDECLLMLDGKPVPLAPKAFEALVTLVESAGHLVDKDDLMRRLWPDSFVEEGNVAKHVSLLRKVLSEATNGREFIETIPKRGYRFVADVREVSDPSTGSEAQALQLQTRLARSGTPWHLGLSPWCFLSQSQSYGSAERGRLPDSPLLSCNCASSQAIPMRTVSCLEQFLPMASTWPTATRRGCECKSSQLARPRHPPARRA